MGAGECMIADFGRMQGGSDGREPLSEAVLCKGRRHDGE